jgi:hypothetical protein
VDFSGRSSDIMRDFVKKNLVRTTLLVYLLVMFSALTTYADQAILEDIEITKADSHLLLYFNVADCFTEDMEKAINNGIYTTFNFFIRIYKVRNFWWNKKIESIKVSHDVQYDSLKKVYLVGRSEMKDKKITVRDLDEVKELMCQVMGLRVAELQNLQTGLKYQVRMMAELDKIKLPLKLHNVLFFLSLWDFKTDWYTLDFTY